MQFDQIISRIKADPAPYAIGVGIYVAVGIFVLWKICRSGGARLSLTGIARAVLTILFALPIWPVVWLVWILHFRKFAPDAIDLTNFRLPVIDLADHRADDIRFAPKKMVVEAEIVESPAKEFAPFGSAKSPTPGKPRPKTKPVSQIAPKKPSETIPNEQKDRPTPKPPRTPSPPPTATSPNPAETQPEDSHGPPQAPPAEKPASTPPLKPTAAPKPTAATGAPAPPKIKRPSATHPHPNQAPSPPPARSADAAPVAPKWPSVAVDPRTPEPPSAPPFVRKMERPESEQGKGPAAQPAPFPSPAPASEDSSASRPQSGDPNDTAPENSPKPDVPEIPIH